MQGLYNFTKHDEQIIATRKYTVSKKHNMAKLTIKIVWLNIIIKFLY